MTGVSLAQSVSLADIEAARERIAAHLSESPLLTSKSLAQMAGCDLHFKAENFTRTGSFKPHGAYNAVLQLTPEQRARGVATVSAGNHGQALALAAAGANAQCTVFMTSSAVQAKVDAIRSHGASIDFSPTFHEAFERLDAAVAEQGLTLVHPFADPAVIAGQGVVGLEILEQAPDVEQIVVPIGGGGLINGIAIAVKRIRPEVRIVGVETTGSPTMHAALQAGKPVRLEKLDSIADGLSAPFTTELNLAITQAFVDDVVLVTDDEVMQAMRLLLERGKVLAEPAGAAAFAAVLTNKAAIPTGAVTVALISGGNIDANRLKTLL